MKYFLGIDTSNYRTSAAICDEDGNCVKNVRRLLPVKEGERGLRQSEALFEHTKALPEILEEIGKYEISAVGYSAKPRDAEGSYMPCFLAGESAARGIAALYGVKAYPFSHQNGHVTAALWSSKFSDLNSGKVPDESGKFVAFHLSGGTTEALLYEDGNITLLGGTEDLNAGQVIDRAGVMMGLPFPAGEEMEKLAGDLPITKGIKVSVKGLSCHLSGIENLASGLYKSGAGKEEVAAFTLDAVLKTVDKLTGNVTVACPGLTVLYAGGVMACGRIKKELAKKYKCVFALPEFSGDNAFGTALLARRAYLKENGK